jgi:Sulfotransferase domain
MKVIGAGLPRTATTTQLIVLEQLGFGPAYHMRDLMADFETGLPLWEDVAAGKPDWERIFGAAQSCVDWPAARYWRELIDYYPDAKVLLSVRSAESWVRSMRETIAAMFFGDSAMHHLNYARAAIDPVWRRYLDVCIGLTWDKEIGAMGDCDPYSDQSLMDGMDRYNESVKAGVPADRLLVWHPADGWDPLCEFLEVPVPDGPVPHTNDTAGFKEGINGGNLAVLNAWWDKRERPSSGLHGAPLT